MRLIFLRNNVAAPVLDSRLSTSSVSAFYTYLKVSSTFAESEVRHMCKACTYVGIFDNDPALVNCSYEGGSEPVYTLR